jgi:hypothetical protein
MRQRLRGEEARREFNPEIYLSLRLQYFLVERVNVQLHRAKLSAWLARGLAVKPPRLAGKER